MRGLLADGRLESIAGLPAAVSAELGTWVTPEPGPRTAGISLYVVYTTNGDLTRNYSGFVRYGSGAGSSEGLIYLQTREAGSDGIQARIDLAGGSTNQGLTQAGGRLAGTHVHSTVINEGCTLATGSLDSGPLVPKVLVPGAGIPRERLMIDNGAGPQTVPLLAVAYNAEHDLGTRRRIEACLRTLRIPPQSSAPTYTRAGTGTTTFTPAQLPTDPVTVYTCWPGGLKASERFSIGSPAWLAAGRSGDGRAFAMRQSISGSTVIAYADRVVTEGVPIVMSATADGTKISVQTLGDGAPRSSSIACGPAQSDPSTITTSGAFGAPTVHIYRGLHSDAKRNTIMRLLAERFSIPIP